MTLKGYLSTMSVATLIATACFVLVTGVVDPYTTNWLGFMIFYGSLFAVVMGLASIIGFIMRFVILRRHLAMSAVVISFRQAFLTAFVVLAVFVLFAQGWFSWLNFTALVIAFSALEFFLLSLTTEK